MAKHASPAAVGGFVVGATVLAVGGILAFGSGDFFRKENKVVAFFEDSVAGLDVGAPISVRGVQVGTVSEIHAVWNPSGDDVNIPVELTLFEGVIKPSKGMEHLIDAPPFEVVNALIDFGLRAELKQASLVTGKLFVALDFFPDEPPRLIGGTELPEIPTREGGFAKLAKTIEDLPIHDLFEGANETIQELRVLVSDPQIKETIHGVNTLVTDLNTEMKAVSDSAQLTLEDVRGLIRDLDDQIGPLSDSTQVTLQDIQSLARTLEEEVEPLTTSLELTLADTRKVLARVDKALGGDYTLLLGLSVLLEETTQAIRSLDQLLNYLQQHPEALLSGKPE